MEEAFAELERSVYAALHTYSNVHRGSGHNSMASTRLYEEARRMSTESLVQHRRLGDAPGEALCRNNLGATLLILGDHDAAAEHFRESVAISERHALASTRVYRWPTWPNSS